MSFNLKIGKQSDSQFIQAAGSIAVQARLGQVNTVSNILNKTLFDGGSSSIHKFGQLFSVTNVSSDVRIEKTRQARNLSEQDIHNEGTYHIEPKHLEEPSDQETSLPSHKVIERDETNAAIPTKLPLEGGYALELLDDPLLTTEEDLALRDETVVHIEKKPSSSAIFGILSGIPVIGSVLAIITSLGHLFGMINSYFGLKKAASSLLKAQQLNADQSVILQKAANVFKQAVNYTTHRNYFNGSVLSIIPFAKPIKRLLQLCCSKPQSEAPTPIAQPEIPPGGEYLLSSCS